MLVTSGLTKDYGSAQLRFPDIQLGDGEQCILVGDSGKGKTTLLHILGGLLEASSGNIVLNKESLSEITPSKMDRFRGENIGFIFQKNHLVSALNVRENIALAQKLASSKVDYDRVDYVLNELGLSDQSYSKISNISHGQAQRVAIARAMVNKPQLILADEPTASLDDQHANTVITMLRNQADKYNANMIVATHDQRVKDMFDNKIVLN